MNKDEFNKLFGNYVKKIRIERGLSQMDVASSIGVNPQNISAIERGEVSPTFFWIVKLCENLEIEPNQFISSFFEYQNC